MARVIVTTSTETRVSYPLSSACISRALSSTCGLPIMYYVFPCHCASNVTTLYRSRKLSSDIFLNAEPYIIPLIPSIGSALAHATVTRIPALFVKVYGLVVSWRALFEGMPRERTFSFFLVSITRLRTTEDTDGVQCKKTGPARKPPCMCRFKHSLSIHALQGTVLLPLLQAYGNQSHTTQPTCPSLLQHRSRSNRRYYERITNAASIGKSIGASHA